MAVSAPSLYPLMGIFKLTQVSPSPGIYPAKTRVRLNNGKVAVYTIAGGALNPSTSGLAIAANGTLSAGASGGTAGPWITMNDVTTSATEYLWVRSSADEIYP